MIFGHVSNKLAPQQTDLVRVDHRVTTHAEDRQIVLRFLRNRFLTATSTRNELFRARVIAQTIRNCLRTARLHARRPYHGPILTQLHRRQRLLWTQRHLRWTQRDWNRVVFSDESRFTLHFADGRVRTFGEDEVNGTTRDVCRKWTVFGGGSVMVWGAFNGPARLRLIVVQGNLNSCRIQRSNAHSRAFAIHGSSWPRSDIPTR